MMKREKRFRASIYVDIFINEMKDGENGNEEEGYVQKSLEEMREEPKEQVNEIVKEISKLDMSIAPGVSNPYVGGVALLTGDIFQPLDKNI